MARYRIETPVPGVSTDLGNVHFHLGVAEVDEVPHWLRNYCEQNGYPITDTQPAEDAADEGVEDDDANPLTRPPGNAKVSVWRQHAIAVGADPEAVNKMPRDEVIALVDERGTQTQTGTQEGAQE
jgi:hypothetical protein